MRYSKKNIGIVLLLAIALLCMVILLYVNNSALDDSLETTNPGLGSEPIYDYGIARQGELIEADKKDDSKDDQTNASQDNVVESDGAEDDNTEIKQAKIHKAEAKKVELDRLDPKQSDSPPPENLGVSLSISCASILDNMDKLDEGKKALVPGDGQILPAMVYSFDPGESVLDLVQRVLRDEEIHFDILHNPVYKSAYIRGINNIYEFDVGPLSGWLYRVNGDFPSYGLSAYFLEAGDEVELVYTCDLGRDF